MGIDGLRSGLISDPGWVRDMAETHADLLIAMAERILEAGYELDAVFLLNGLAGRAAPRIARRDYLETFAPVDLRVAGFFHGRGMKVLLYAPGDLRVLVPDLIDVGVDCLGPCQAAAGMDVRILKVNYGADLSMLGGIDLRALLQPDPVLLEREIDRKVTGAMIGGGYIAGFDGPIPAKATPSRYQQALDLLNRFGKY
jgi:uroporphyrinogen decarboxylase